MAEDGCINNAVFQDLDILGTFSLPEINISNTATFGNSIQNDLIINSTIKMPLSNDVEHTEGFQLVRQTDRSLKFEPKANDVFKTIRIDNQELINASGLEDTLKLVAGKNMTIETDTSTNPNTISFSSSNGSNVQNIYKTIRVKNNDLIPNTSTDILEFIEGNDIILNVNENNEDTNIYESIIKYNDNLTDTSGGTLTLYNIDDNLNEVFTVLSSTETELEYQCKIIYTDDIQNATSGTIILHTGSTQVIFTLVSSTPSDNEFIIGTDVDQTGTNIQRSINNNNNFSCTIDTSTNTLTITNNTNFVYTNTNSHTFTTGISSIENFVTKECFRTNNLEDTAENIRVMINNHPEFTANLNTNSREIKVSQTISQNNTIITDNAENLLGVISITNFTQVIRELSSIRISLNQNIESDLIIGNYNNNLLTVNSESFFNNSVTFNNATFYNNEATFNNLINLNNIQINNNEIITNKIDQDLIINPNGTGRVYISSDLSINSNNIDNVNNLACSTITFGSTEIDENEISILNNHTITSAELNILDGDTTADTGLTLENDDKLIITDITDGTDTNIVKQIEFTKVKDYIESNATQISGLVTVGTLNDLSVTGDITVNTSSLKVDTTNNRLGIGTSTPSEKLHLYQTASEGPNIKIDNIKNMERIAFTSFSGVLPSDDPETSSYLNFSSWPDVSYPRQFLYINRDVDKQYTSTGPVLQNDLAIEFGYSNYFYRSGETNPSSAYYPAGSAIRFHTATNNSTLTEKMCIDYQGNVGIGTTNPISRVDMQYGGDGNVQNNITDVSRYNLNLGISDEEADGTNSAGICITDFRNPTQVLSSIIGYDDGASNRTALNFNVYNGSSLIEGMRIDSSGNVGIGTTSPSAKLHIRSNTTGQNSLLILENNTTTWGGNDDGASIEFRTYDTGNETIRSQAKILIADPTTNSSEDADLVFQTRGTGSVTEKMRISNLGNVGIGTNNPTSKLHVNGEVKVEGNVGIGIDPDSPGSYKLNVNGTANISGDVDIGGSTNITGSLTSNSTTVNDLTINGLSNDSGVLVNYNSSIISKISVGENDDRVALVYKDDAFDWVGFGTIASGGVNVNDLGILNTPLDGDFLIGLDRNNTFINNSVSKFYQEIDIIDSILRISTTTQGNGDLILSSEPYDSNDNNPYLKVTDNLDFNILTDRLNLRDKVNNVVTNKLVESFVNLLIEDHESRLQLISTDSGAAGSLIALSNAPSSGNQKNWVFHHFGPTQSNKLGIYYKENNTPVDSSTDTLYTNSNIGLTLDTSGKIGIGINSPDKNLHIYNSTESIIKLHKNVSSSGSCSLEFHDSTSIVGYLGNNTGRDLTLSNLTASNLVFQTNSSDRMTINSSGNVGIGTTIPSSKLHVNGNGEVLRLQGSNNSYISFYPQGNTTRHAYIGVESNLNVNDFTISNEASGDIIFRTTNTNNERMRILNSGNVGIGTLIPNEKLHVNGNIKLTGELYFDGERDFSIYTAGSGSNAYLTIKTNTDAKNIYFRSQDDSAKYTFGLNNSSGTSSLGINDGNLYVSGNVGIGLSPTTNKLDVNGQAKIRSHMEVDGNIDLNSSSSNNRQFIGYGTIPIGGIIMWNGSTAPDGWALCDGYNGTPNLSGRFVMGKGTISQSSTSGGTVSYNVQQTGGVQKHKLNLGEMPSHNHGIKINSSSSNEGGNGRNSIMTDDQNSYWGNMNLIQTNAAGSSETHENRPPYYVLAYIMRIR